HGVAPATKPRSEASRRACYPADLPVSEPQPAPSGAGQPFVRALWLIFLAGLALRAAFLLFEPPTFPVGDERTYLTWGTQYLPSGRVAFSPFRMHLIFPPPLYPYFIAAFQSFPGGLAVVHWVQVFLSALLVPAVGRLGARASGALAGLV